MSGTFRRYDQDAKLAVYYAAILAPQRGKSCISPDDLLLGLTWRQHASDCDFRELKDSYVEIWQSFEMPHLPISKRPYQPGKLPLDRAAKRVLHVTKT